MDEIQTDGILMDADLTDARAPFVKIAESAPTDNLHRIWSHGCDDVPQLQDDILQMRRYALKKCFNLMEWEHGLLLFSQPHEEQTMDAANDRACDNQYPCHEQDGLPQCGHFEREINAPEDNRHSTCPCQHVRGDP